MYRKPLNLRIGAEEMDELSAIAREAEVSRSLVVRALLSMSMGADRRPELMRRLKGYRKVL